MNNLFFRSYLPLVLFGFGLVSFVPSILQVNPVIITIGFRAYLMGLSLILLLVTVHQIKKMNKYLVMISIFLFMYGVRLVVDTNDFNFGMAPEILYLRFTSFILLPFFTLSLVRLKPDIEWLSFYILFIIIVSSFITLSSSTQLLRLSGNDILNPITLGYYASYLIITILYILHIGKVALSNKILFVFTLSLSITVLIASLSRGSIIGLFGVLLLEFFSTRRKNFFWPLVVLVVFVISSYFLLNTFESLRTDRLVIDTGAEGGGGEMRVFLWSTAIENIFKHPILGSHVTTSFGYVHNVYLESIMATGLIGSIFLIIPLGVFIFRFVKSRRAGFKVPITHYYCIFAIFTAMFSGTIYNSTFLFALLPVVFNYGKRSEAKLL